MARAIRSSACAASASRWRGRRYSACSCGRWRARPFTATLKVMLPMVAVPAELDRAAAHARRGGRGAQGERASPARRPPLGIMVEVPAAALCAEDFDAGVLFHRLERPDPIHDGRGARHRRRRRPQRCRRSGGAGISSPAPSRPGASAASRSRSAATRRPTPRLTTALLATGLTTLSVAPVAVARLKAAIAAVGS